MLNKINTSDIVLRDHKRLVLGGKEVIGVLKLACCFPVIVEVNIDEQRAYAHHHLTKYLYGDAMERIYDVTNMIAKDAATHDVLDALGQIRIDLKGTP